jgi:hypothetical protein
MTKVKVDFSDAESFEAVPEGEYAVVISEAELRESRSSEHPYVSLTLDIAEGEEEGRKLWMNCSLHPKALWNTRETFENLGVFEEELEIEVDEDDEKTILEPEFVGMPAIAVVEHEIQKQGRNKGKPRANVVALLGPNGPRPAQGEKKAKAEKPEKKAASKDKTKKPKFQ